MKLSTKIAYNTIVQFASKIISTGLGLVAIALTARYLGQIGFGEYTTAFTFISFFAIAADLGLTLITVQLISPKEANQDKILGNLLALRLVSAIIFLGLAPLSVLFFPYSADIKIAVAILAFSFLFVALNQILVGLFQKHLRMDKVSIAEVASRIVLIVATVYAIKTNKGLNGIVAAAVLSSAASFIMHYIFSFNFARIKLHFDFSYWKKIISRSWPLAITIVFNLIYLKMDTLLLSIIKRPTKIGIMAEVGIYGAAYRVIDVLITFPFMFAGIILPILTARWTEGREDDFKKVLQKSFDVMAILAIPLIIGAQFTAKEIMTIVAGEEFIASGPVLRILIGAAALIFLGVMFSHAIIAINKQRQIIWAYIFTAVSSVIGYFIIIPHFSYFGAAWVTIYSESFIAAASLFLIYKYTKFLPNIKIILKSLAASAVMALFIYLFNNILLLNLFLTLGLAILVYFISLYFFKGLKKQDILSLLNK